MCAYPKLRVGLRLIDFETQGFSLFTERKNVGWAQTLAMPQTLPA